MSSLLLAFFEPEASAKLVPALQGRGYAVRVAADGPQFREALAAAPELLLFNSLPGAEPVLVYLKQYLHSPSANGMKAMAVVNDGNLGTLEAHFAAGISDCVPRPFRLGDLLDRLDKLRDGAAAGAGSVKLDGTYNTVPRELDDRVQAFRADARELGDIAEIFNGFAAHDSSGRRLSPPNPDWVPVLTEKSVSPFYVNDEREFYRLHRSLLNRVPEKYEYFGEKVLFRRVMSPVSAALDLSRQPYNSGLMGILPVRGLDPGYLTCLLNSRVAHFYLHRYRPAGKGVEGVYFSRFDLEAFPVIIAKPDEQAALAAIAREMAKISPGTRSTELQSARGRMLADINRRVFQLYGFAEEEVRLLGTLHY